MSNRDARPLPPKGHAALHDAAIEEIHQGRISWGLPVLLGLHTGLRRRLIIHYTDDWRGGSENGEEIQTPKEVNCTIAENGCYNCNSKGTFNTGGPDGVIRPKTSAGQQRTIPVFDTWCDTHNEEKRETELSKWLDHYFETHGAGWGYESQHFTGHVIKRVAMRRHDVIKETHQGEEETWMNGEKVTVPDIIGHDTRASWATQCLRTGVEDDTLMDWGGWKSRDMIDHYRGFIGDPSGGQKSQYEEGRDDNNGGDDSEDVDMVEALEVYNKITENNRINPAEYDNAVLEAAYEMVEGS
jgi:hypothetical protein